MLIRRLILPFLLALAAVVANAQTPGPTPEPGFRLKGIDGKTYDSASMKGDVLVVSFGATWCVPCVWELVAIEELKEEFAGKPVRFFWVSVEDPKRASDNILRHFARERRLTIPVLRDPASETFMRYEKTTRLPVLVFFDREGRFDSPAHRGMSQDTTLYKQMVRARVNALLASAAPAGAGGRAVSDR
ncbi:MAG TPA: TlpA disulfide reductase family protein [Pyrinomonadaceae bacterium]|nr:TlpA disulfide reductase family protein [Pyrinomonadaceae bacterium]